MHVVQTLGDEPNHGRMYLAMSGWTWNSRKALRKTVEQNRRIAREPLPVSGPEGVAVADSSVSPTSERASVSEEIRGFGLFGADSRDLATIFLSSRVYRDWMGTHLWRLRTNWTGRNPVPAQDSCHPPYTT